MLIFFLLGKTGILKLQGRKEAGYKNPKSLIMVDNEPIIEHVINLFPEEKNIKFICNDKHLKETNMKAILNNKCPYGKIYEVLFEGIQGSVHTVS